MLDQIHRQVADAGDGRSATDIAAAIGALITSGALEPGEKLPTVRALAVQLDVSPSTVAESWRLLRAHRVITTDRRRGTMVRTNRGQVTGRSWQVPVERGVLDLDLSVGTPDPALLPDLAPMLSAISANPPVTSYIDEPLVPELADELRAIWPFEPRRLTVVDGAQDALDRIVTAVVGVGDTVVVEDPTFPPLLDMLELAGARIAPVPVDANGLVPDRLAEALTARPVALFHQPRAHNPTGASLTPRRARALADLVGDTEALVVEDDHSADVAGAEIHSLGRYLPDRTIHIRSFSKSHGPDLRIAAIGGADEPIQGIIRRRQLGPSWTSRLIQHLLLTMLRDPDTRQRVATATATYAERRAALVDSLGHLGVTVADGNGLNVWVPVANETAAAVFLAANGIGVAPGSPFQVVDAPHRIRVTAGLLADRHDQVAGLIAAAARPPR